jgi:hypothetical protein
MSFLKYLQLDLETTPGLTCPSCQANTVRGRSTPRSIRIAAAFTILLWFGFLLLSRLRPEGSFNLRALVLLGVLASFAATVASALSTWFGWNRCLECGHRWR